MVTINTCYILRMFADKRYWKDIISSLIREPNTGSDLYTTIKFLSNARI